MNAYCIICGRQFELPAEVPNEPNMICWLCQDLSNKKPAKQKDKD
jgi:hypothetical protein